MSRFLKAFLVPVGWCYLLAAFYNWDAYPGHWSESSRAVSSILGTVAGVLSMIVSFVPRDFLE